MLYVVSLSQIFGGAGAGIMAEVTVGSLLAQQMLGTDAYAKMPVALFLIIQNKYLQITNYNCIFLVSIRNWVLAGGFDDNN